MTPINDNERLIEESPLMWSAYCAFLGLIGPLPLPERSLAAIAFLKGSSAVSQCLLPRLDELNQEIRGLESRIAQYESILSPKAKA